MAEAAGRRRCLEEKEAFQNLVLSVPCFIAQQPTRHVAVSKEHPALTHPSFQDRLYYNSSRFVSTRLYTFPTPQQAETFLQAYSESVVKPSQGRQWVEYCYSDEAFEDVLFHPGCVFVPWPESQVRDLLGEVSQLVVCHGLPMEEHLRRSSPLLRFLDHRVLSLEHIYYRWRVYAYLQGDGERRYRNESYSMVRTGQQWFPPLPPTLQRVLLNHRQRRHFAQLLGRISRRKHEVEEAMVFAISRVECGVEVAAMVALEILHRVAGDFLPLFYLISDVLFNSTTPDYRKLFAYLLPLLLQRLSTTLNTKFRSELRALIHHWELKFIFQDSYTQGLLFLLAEGGSATARGVHNRLDAIGRIQDQEESEFQLEKLCLANGIPLLSGNREESMRLINEYLWRQETEQLPPQLNESYDGEPLTEKDLMRIKTKQVKVVASEGLSVGLLLEKNWQTKGRMGQGGSIEGDPN